MDSKTKFFLQTFSKIGKNVGRNVTEIFKSATFFSSLLFSAFSKTFHFYFRSYWYYSNSILKPYWYYTKSILFWYCSDAILIRYWFYIDTVLKLCLGRSPIFHILLKCFVDKGCILVFRKMGHSRPLLLYFRLSYYTIGR